MNHLGAVAAQNAEDHTSKRAPFLKLPRELRDRIYSLVWGDEKNVVVEVRDSTLVVQYRPKGNPVRIREVGVWDDQEDRWPTTLAGSAWLFTCKQLLQEGLEEFQRKAY